MNSVSHKSGGGTVSQLTTHIPIDDIYFLKDFLVDIKIVFKIVWSTGLHTMFTKSSK
jgi:hypothetical protein